MNYMKMVKFIKVDKENVTARFIVKENERSDLLDMPVLAPHFLVLEAIFQTAGKVARDNTNNQYGGTIVSFKNISFTKPVLTDDITYIEARLASYNKVRRCFFIKIVVTIADEVVVENGEVIIMQDTSIKTNYLNNKDTEFRDQLLAKIGY